MRRVLRHIDRIEAARLIEVYASALGVDALQSFLLRKTTGESQSKIFGETYFSMLQQAAPGTISFCSFNGKDDPRRRAGDISVSQASLVIADPRLAKFTRPGADQFVIFIDEPKIAFIRLLFAMSDPVRPEFMRQFPESCYIGPNVFVEKGCTIGENVVLVGNNYVYANTVIGNNVHVKPGTVIGGEGYEHTPDRNGTLHFMPHLGGVIIEDNVMIGSCTCVDRGVFGDTLIRAGARIDNLVHVAHNVVIGQNSLIIANVMIGGSTVIGDNTRIAPSASLLNSIAIGHNCIVGMGSAVLRDVPSNDVVYGVPAKSKSLTPVKGVMPERVLSK